MMQLPTDARLARRAAAGDQRAFGAIFERYQAALYRFCLSILGRPEDAQDALQNTMLKALRALPGEEREIELRPWLYRVAHNESIEVLRRRRETVELQPDAVADSDDPGQTVALRDRLRRLFADLGQLPERQRAALVMRELGGLGFEQIGKAFETSASVARQTVYEARLSLRQLEEGREMGCDQVTRQLSDADGRVLRRRDVQAHLRDCPECRAFRDSIASRRHDLAALAPLPAATVGSILHGFLGAQAAGGGTAGVATAGAGKVVATSALVKGVATVAVVATVGVTAADRGGLVHLGLPGDHAERNAGSPGSAGASSAAGNGTAGAGTGAATPGDSGKTRDSTATGVARAAPSKASGSTDAGSGTDGNASSPATNAETSAVPGAATSEGAPGHSHSHPAAATHGQETAASHKSTHASNPGHGHGQARANGTHSGHGGASGSQGKGHKASPAPAKGGKGNGTSAGKQGPPAHGKGTATGQVKKGEGGQPALEPSSTDGQGHEASP